ncbi:DUF3298 domain-containing protein [Luteimonas sp. RD2P54]|uniref:DUF3298 domain-containing protein n=1 Tax=Luteimonas endophytica TaxID=3042023 RepID=A0ABT6J9F7_9GAMM|nr:DUF3298 and DUF4163 domain-containing protein [Luteimonas endophytica]MDH5823235.1 DUF3298 domain-containing protein [Luteimonas endophytica]
MKRGSICLVLMLVLATAACRRESGPPQVPAPAQDAQMSGPDGASVPRPAAPAVPVELEDVIEHDPRFVVGISYPSAASRYPGLAAELNRYAQAARAELAAAVDAMGEGRPPAPYDLSLEFRMVAETPRVVAVAADGSTYTGGAHGNPLVARFVWLPRQQRLLRAQDLFADQSGWQALAGYVREQLHAELSQRVDAEELEPGQRLETIRSAGRMIDEGSAPDPDNFAHFEPVMAVDGRIRALRFVFPPYQVAPYADGTRSVEVPADVLAAHLAEPVKPLFVTG